MVRKRKLLHPREAHLREEIDFWDALIHDWEKNSTAEVPDIMRDALAFAKYRLELYLSDEVFLAGDIPPHGPQENDTR